MQRHGLRHRPWVPNRWEPRGAHRRETSRRTTHPSSSHGSDGPDGLEADPWGTHLELDHPGRLDTAAWAATSPVGSLSRGAQRNAPAGDAEADYTTTGLDGPTRTWSRGAADRDGSASAASKSGFAPQGRTPLQACTRHMTPRRPSARVTVPATGHETTARSGITMRAGAPRRSAPAAGGVRAPGPFRDCPPVSTQSAPPSKRHASRPSASHRAVS